MDEPPRTARIIEFRNPVHPWPDRPEIPELTLSYGNDEGVLGSVYPPTDEEIDEENARMLLRQCQLRWAAQSIAVALSELPCVLKVAAFGAVAKPLEMEVSRFAQFRANRVEVLHECGDLDLAVWTTRLGKLQDLKKALRGGIEDLQDMPYGGVAYHQVDVHVLDAHNGSYSGRLCRFRECPKRGKTECRVPGCGAQPFLQQFGSYIFNPAQFDGEPKVVLFDRASGFIVRKPRIEVKHRAVATRASQDDNDPF